MPISMEPASGVAADGVLTVKVSGQLTAAEWHAAQKSAIDAMTGSPDKVPILIVAEKFLGWERGGWPESPFQAQFDSCVDRMAIVGEVQWEDLALLFAGKGLRRFPIEYFPSSGTEAARKWLQSDVHLKPDRERA